MPVRPRNQNRTSHKKRHPITALLPVRMAFSVYLFGFVKALCRDHSMYRVTTLDFAVLPYLSLTTQYALRPALLSDIVIL